MLISIITPAFRAQAFIGRAVKSVLAQDYPHWEMLIISDDGADYRSVLHNGGIEDPRLRFLSTGRIGAGPNVARNMGLRGARGDFIAPLDADDLFYPQRLSALAPLAGRHGMAGDNLVVIEDHTGHRLGTVFPQSDTLRWLDMATFARYSTPLLFVFQRQIIDFLWDETVALGADTLFNLRALEKTGPAPILPQVLHEYRIVPDSICHSSDAHERAERAYALCLEQWQVNRLNFTTVEGGAIVKGMLLRKRELNRRFRQCLEAGRCHNFQEFIAAGLDTSPPHSTPQRQPSAIEVRHGNRF